MTKKVELVPDSQKPSDFNSCCNQAPRTINSRRKNGYKYRRYACDVCGVRFSTCEVACTVDIGDWSEDALRRALTKMLADPEHERLLLAAEAFMAAYKTES